MPSSHVILVADDEPMLRRVLSKVLIRAGYNVVAVEDGVQALQKIHEQQFDLHIFDQNMPGHTGKELLSILRAKDPHIRIVISSGETLSFTSQEEQPTGLLEKPFVLKGLLNKIASFLDTQKS
jgi:CheY-like chemotaxis protein